MAKRMETTVLLMFISLVVMTSAVGRCPASWTVFRNSCYKIITEKVTWFEAQAICLHAYSQLITIGSKAEDDFAVKLARGHGNTWIGLTDLVEEGQFLWKNFEKPKYTHWSKGQPDNYWKREDCAHLWARNNYFWNDVHCSENKFSAICEKKPFFLG